ncbi:hypothetical protein DFP90_104254 [Aestuariispira insulae]|uniref:Uncharacterized protein n=1 Tax=Aestuariispira insulae TaxID=1461337 RepID=A0A3D9HNV1_9PROT|nr:hypothetical protein DFP90_104254 [Aestuariispira insulae]
MNNLVRLAAKPQFFPSLRRYNPDQVQRVSVAPKLAITVSQPFLRAPLGIVLIFASVPGQVNC